LKTYEHFNKPVQELLSLTKPYFKFLGDDIWFTYSFNKWSLTRHFGCLPLLKQVFQFHNSVPVHEYYDEQFYEKINHYDKCIPFKNGVFDLKEFKFRGSRPDDYMTLTLWYDYEECDDITVNKTLVNLTSIFGSHEKRDEFMMDIVNAFETNDDLIVIREGYYNFLNIIDNVLRGLSVQGRPFSVLGGPFSVLHGRYVLSSSEYLKHVYSYGQTVIMSVSCHEGGDNKILNLGNQNVNVKIYDVNNFNLTEFDLKAFSWLLINVYFFKKMNTNTENSDISDEEMMTDEVESNKRKREDVEIEIEINKRIKINEYQMLDEDNKKMINDHHSRLKRIQKWNLMTYAEISRQNRQVDNI
jgi:hypothetical protein